jgi:hypothetical protein
MAPLPVRWTKVHDNGLKELFTSKEAHPERQQNDYIAGIFKDVEDRACFQGIDGDKFRKHYKTKAAQWLTEQSMAGRRRRESSCSLLILPCHFVHSHCCFVPLLAEAIQEDFEEEFCSDKDEDSDEESQQETARMPATKLAAKPAALSKRAPLLPARGQLKSPPAVAVEHEVPWLPVFSRHTYPAKGHDRYMYVIGLPGSFSGAKGSYKLGIDKNGTELFFTVPVDEVFTDPHQVHSFLTEEYGRLFSSTVTRNWKESARPMKGKMAAFRHTLDFPCQRKFSDDMKNPGILFAKIEKGKNKVPVLILELKSLHIIENDDCENEDLVFKTFKSPEKVVGVHGETAQLAKMMEIMFKNNLTRATIQGELKRGGFEVSDMDIDGAHKRSKETG